MTQLKTAYIFGTICRQAHPRHRTQVVWHDLKIYSMENNYLFKSLEHSDNVARSNIYSYRYYFNHHFTGHKMHPKLVLKSYITRV